MSELKEAMKKFIEKDETVDDVWGISGMAAGVANNPKDYASMYHNVDGEMVRHDKVHNLFGYNMTRTAGEALSLGSHRMRDDFCSPDRLI